MPALSPKIDTTTEVDLRDFERFIARFEAETGKKFVAAYLQGMRGVARRVQSITPPASKKSARGNISPGSSRPKLTQEDKRRGENSLHADLLAVFSGEETTGARKRPSAQQMQDIETIHDRLFLKKIPGKPLKSDLANGAKYHVPAAAIVRLENKLKKNVGWLAAGWNKGCRALGISPPAWVANKAGQGSADVKTSGLNSHVTITHSGVPDRLEGEMERRVNWAVKAQMNAMQRQMNAVAAMQAKKAA